MFQMMGWHQNESGMTYEWKNDTWMIGWQRNDWLTFEWLNGNGMTSDWHNLDWMTTEWGRKKSRAFALLQKIESFHPHSSHSKSFQDEKIVIPASFQSFWGHSVSEWPWNDDKVISKWLKMTGMVRDGGDQNILHDPWMIKYGLNEGRMRKKKI